MDITHCWPLILSVFSDSPHSVQTFVISTGMNTHMHNTYSQVATIISLYCKLTRVT